MQKAGSQPTRASAFPTEATSPNQGRTGPGLFRQGAAFIFVRWDIGSEHQGRLRAGGLSRVAAEDGAARSDSGHASEIDPLELGRHRGRGEGQRHQGAVRFCTERRVSAGRLLQDRPPLHSGSLFRLTHFLGGIVHP